MSIDLRELILLIKQNKDFAAHLCLDIGCKIEGHDPKPLILTINYIINYLKESGQGEIQIDLDSHNAKHQLVFIIHTDKRDLSAPSDNLKDSLSIFGGTLEWIFEPARFVKFQLVFDRS